MITSDALMGFGILGLVGYGIGSTVKEEGGFFNCFDIEQGKKVKAIQKFWHELGNSLFGKDGSTNTDTYTDRTPEVIKKDSLSAK